jgi:hypothetical protein
VASVFPNANYLTTATSLTTTNETTCYTVPATRKGAYVVQILACDTGGVARTLTIKARKSGTDYVIANGQSVDAGEGLDREFKPLQLGPSDSIKCTASNGSIDVLITAAEIAEYSGL